MIMCYMLLSYALSEGLTDSESVMPHSLTSFLLRLIV